MWLAEPEMNPENVFGGSKSKNFALKKIDSI